MMRLHSLARVRRLSPRGGVPVGRGRRSSTIPGRSAFRRVGKRTSRVVHTHEIAGSNPAPATSFLVRFPCGPP